MEKYLITYEGKPVAISNSRELALLIGNIQSYKGRTYEFRRINTEEAKKIFQEEIIGKLESILD